MKQLLHTLLALTIAALALLYALWGVDFRHLADLLAEAEYRLLVPFQALLVLFFLFTGLRWNVILRSQGRYSLRQSAPAMLIGFAGNNVLPAHLGELARAVVFGRQAGLPATAVFMTLVVERLLDVLAILVYYFLAVLLIDSFPASIRMGAQAVGIVMGVASLGIVAFLRWPTAFVRLWERLSAPLPASLRGRGSDLLRSAEQGLAALKSLPLLAAMVAYSLLKWATCGGMVWLALLAFGTRIPFSISMIVIAVTALAVTVPTAPGFFGTMQAAFVLALAPFGVAQETALAASVFYLLAQWLPVTVVGGLCFAASDLRMKEVREEAERVRP